MGLKMEDKREALLESGDPRPHISSPETLSSIEEGGRGEGRRQKRQRFPFLFHRLNPNLMLFLLFFFISSVKGNSEMESCMGASAVKCNIRVLHPTLSLENLTSSISTGSGGITKLSIVCSDVLFFESGVSPGQLEIPALANLRELTISRCKLKHLPAGFLPPSLVKLIIRPGNSDWSARSLDIAQGAFTKSYHLKELDLGTAQIWALPKGLLCQAGLQHLNLTMNGFSDFEDLGIVPFESHLRTTASISPVVGGCLNTLKSLDLSHNSLRTLGSRRFESMTKLEELFLDMNLLEELYDDAFFGLEHLKKLQMRSNRLVALPVKLFEPCRLLEVLILRNNSITALSPGLLKGLEHLQVLDLSMNSLNGQWVTSESFKSLIRLIILNLSENQLTHLGSSTFQDLYSVQVLDLSANLIGSIEDSAFSRMSNLHSLNLAKNRLVSINSEMLNGLFVLHKLNLDHNEIQNIESGALKNCTSLQDLGLIGNKLTSIPKALHGLQVRTLDIGENQITHVDSASFTGMSQLIGLRIVDNLLEEITSLCETIPRLRVFNSAQNKITKVSPSAFAACPELKVLRLDSNRLSEIPTLETPNLLWLNVSQNGIPHLSYGWLPASLEWLDVSHNQIETIEGVWSKSNGDLGSHQNQSHSKNERLRVVDASHNLISQLNHHAIPRNLEMLKLGFNKLIKIADDTFNHAHHLRRVELISNQLEKLSLNALRLPLNTKIKPELLLGGNPLLCSCEMEWLTRINQLSAFPMVMDLDVIICRVHSRTVTHIPLPDMTPQDFLCPYNEVCLATCTCCEYLCDCYSVCPKTAIGNCTCLHSDNWGSNIINCAGTAEAVPTMLPMDSTLVFLDGNNLKVLKSHAFIGRRLLKQLYLNNSQIETIQNKSFNGLNSLQSLHLENNLIKVLDGFEFEQLFKLRELFLHNNAIEKINNATFLHLKNLEILILSGNKIKMFAVWQLSLNPYLVEIGLAKNEWNCDCEFLHLLYGWVNDNSRKVIDINQLQCVFNTTHKPGPHIIDYNRTCLSSWSLLGMDGEDFTPFPLILFGIIASTIILVLIVLVVLCRNNARLFFFSHYGIRLCSSDFEDEKLYDAYLVSVSEKDEFVAQKIADELETNDTYHLCVHYRNLISESGESLKDMMLENCENSKAIVLIISRNFIQEWTCGEYRTALNALLKNSKKKKVVIVFIQDIKVSSIDKEIMSWIRENRIPVIKFPQDEKKQAKFFAKLKIELPMTSHYNLNLTSNTTTATSASSESATGGIKATLKYPSNENDQHIIWPYSPNFALPPKYQLPNSQTATMASHLSLNNYNQSIHSQSSPSHHANYQSHHHYHPPLPLSNPPKSPPSSQSTDSTTTTNGDENHSLHSNTPTSFSLMFQQQLQQQHNKSPLPVPKLYSHSPTVNISSNSGGGGGGESYLSLEGEHVYSTLDPPSPHQQQSRIMHLPNGYSYHQQQMTLQQSQQPQQAQWQTPTPKGTLTYGSAKSYKHSKDSANPVQTYLV